MEELPYRFAEAAEIPIIWLNESLLQYYLNKKQHAVKKGSAFRQNNKSIKVLVTLFQKRVVSKGNALAVFHRKRNSFAVQELLG